jgi:hypothetical protein
MALSHVRPGVFSSPQMMPRSSPMRSTRPACVPGSSFACASEMVVAIRRRY